MNALLNATQVKKNNVNATRAEEMAWPVKPFPQKYVHCVFDEGHDALQAALTLLAAGYDASSVYVLTGEDYINALEEGQSAVGYLTSMDMQVYIEEASLEHTLIVVRPENYEQLRKIRTLLIPHHARLMRYIDTWTTTELID